jgi:hypothetical protein
MTRFAIMLSLAAFACAQNVMAADGAKAPDPSAGRRLFDEAKCNGCHDNMMNGDGNRIFTRADRRITTSPALLKMVRSCIERTGASLFPEDAEHIAAYLNERFYNFK